MMIVTINVLTLCGREYALFLRFLTVFFFFSICFPVWYKIVQIHIVISSVRKRDLFIILFKLLKNNGKMCTFVLTFY